MCACVLARLCMCLRACLFICVSVFVSVVLQALVEVHSGGLGADFSYPLLQFRLQTAHTHGATRRVIEAVGQNEPSIPI